MGLLSIARRFFADDQGLEMVEYSLIAAVVAGALVATTLILTGAVNTGFTNIGTHISTGK